MKPDQVRQRFERAERRLRLAMALYLREHARMLRLRRSIAKGREVRAAEQDEEAARVLKWAIGRSAAPVARSSVPGFGDVQPYGVPPPSMHWHKVETPGPDATGQLWLHGMSDSVAAICPICDTGRRWCLTVDDKPRMAWHAAREDVLAQKHADTCSDCRAWLTARMARFGVAPLATDAEETPPDGDDDEPPAVDDGTGEP